MRFHHRVLAGVLCCAAGTAAWAEGLPERLTLEGAIDQALRHNPAVQTAATRVRERAGEAVAAGRLTPSNPRLGLETARRDAPDDTTTDVGIRVAQEFWTAGKGDLARKAAEARTTGARDRLAYLRTAVTARTRRAFLELLAAREAVTTGERALELAREVADYSQRRLEAGEANRLEVNSAELGVGQARAALAAARRERARARLDLTELLAADPADGFEAAGRLAPVQLDLPDRNRLLNRALQRRKDLAAAAQSVAAAREDLNLAEQQVVPNLTAFGFYKEEEAAEVAGVGVSVPLPLLYRYEGEQQAAAARLERAQVQADAARQQVRREVLAALADYRAARARLEAVSGGMLAAAEENVRLTQTAVRAGKRGAPALTTAQDQLLSVRRTYLEAQRELIAAGTALERATGGLVVMGQGRTNDRGE